MLFCVIDTESYTHPCEITESMTNIAAITVVSRMLFIVVTANIAVGYVRKISREFIYILPCLADANVAQVRGFLFSPMSATGAQNDASSVFNNARTWPIDYTTKSLSFWQPTSKIDSRNQHKNEHVKECSFIARTIVGRSYVLPCPF